MKSNTKTLTEGPLAKQIFLVSLPLALSNLLQVLFNMSDVAVVGRFAGSTALGAVGSTSILVSLFTGFLIGLSGGINVLVARSCGCTSLVCPLWPCTTSATLCSAPSATPKSR